MNDLMDYLLYVRAEIAYTDKHKEIDEDDLFPIHWYASRNYMLKTKIIAEALDKGITVKETKLYRKAQIKGFL